MRLFDVRRQELPALAWAAGWFFCVLAAYYTIRPVREMFASELSRDQRATLFTLTLLVMLVATPLYGLVVAKLEKRWLVPAVYGFFIACLLAFWGVISAGEVPTWFPGGFFVWISVFNLFVVTLFWGTIVDLFNGDQAKRLFGLIFGAGTLGQLTSSWAVQTLTEYLGMSGLLWVCAGLLGMAILCSWQLRRLMPTQASLLKSTTTATQNVWSTAWQGVTSVARSPYLLGIALFIVSLSLCATVAYFQMTDIVAEQLPNSERPTALVRQNQRYARRCHAAPANRRCRLAATQNWGRPDDGDRSSGFLRRFCHALVHSDAICRRHFFRSPCVRQPSRWGARLSKCCSRRLLQNKNIGQNRSSTPSVNEQATCSEPKLMQHSPLSVGLLRRCRLPCCRSG